MAKHEKVRGHPGFKQISVIGTIIKRKVPSEQKYMLTASFENSSCGKDNFHNSCLLPKTHYF